MRRTSRWRAALWVTLPLLVIPGVAGRMAYAEAIEEIGAVAPVEQVIEPVEAVPEEDAPTEEQVPDVALDTQATGTIASGTCGTCAWDIDASGLLTVHAGTLDSCLFEDEDADWEEDTEELWPESYAFPWTVSEYVHQITAARFVGNVRAKKNLSGLFRECDQMTSVDLTGLDTFGVKYMDGMFMFCEALESVDFSGLDTSLVVNMAGMFEDCYALASLDLSEFDTANVAIMESMFSGCSSLTELDLSGFDTSGVTDMTRMFEDCGHLSRLDISGFDNSQVDDSQYMFDYCYDLWEFSVGSLYDTSKEDAVPGSNNGCGMWWSTSDQSWHEPEDIASDRSFVSDTYSGSAPISAVKFSVAAQTYVGHALTPVPEGTCGGQDLSEGCDFLVKSYQNNVNAGTAKVTVVGDGDYEGSKTLTFSIQRRPLSQTNVCFQKQYEQMARGMMPTAEKWQYTGKAIKPAVYVTCGYGDATLGTDYTASYQNNVNAGTATVTLTGKGNFSGTRTETFTITRAPISKATVGSVASRTYTGKAIKPAPTVKRGTTTLKKDTHYTLSYANNTKVGTATITITGKGNYTGTKKVTFKVVKAANPMVCKAVARTASFSTLKSKAVTVARPITLTTKQQGTLSYAKVASGSSSYLTVNKSTGKVTVKKGTKKGTYTIKIKVTATGNANYKAKAATVTCKVTVK